MDKVRDGELCGKLAGARRVGVDFYKSICEIVQIMLEIEAEFDADDAWVMDTELSEHCMAVQRFARWYKANGEKIENRFSHINGKQLARINMRNYVVKIGAGPVRFNRRNLKMPEYDDFRYLFNLHADDRERERWNQLSQEKSENNKKRAELKEVFINRIRTDGVKIPNTEKAVLFDSEKDKPLPVSIGNDALKNKRYTNKDENNEK